jgi:hypothetical protein
MEFLLLLWDDLDDLTAACRHVTFSAVDEMAQLSGAVTTALMAFTVWLLRFPS